MRGVRLGMSSKMRTIGWDCEDVLDAGATARGNSLNQESPVSCPEQHLSGLDACKRDSEGLWMHLTSFTPTIHRYGDLEAIEDFVAIGKVRLEELSAWTCSLSRSSWLEIFSRIQRISPRS